MYDIYNYGRMIADDIRMRAYAEAMRRTIRPGSVVLDLGTGTGICALLACQLGARRVFAVDSNDAIRLAHRIAEDNGFADRIEFYQQSSIDLELPEPVDTIVSDLRGSMPLFQRHLHAIMDARSRLLAPGGNLIPLRDELRVALVEAPDVYESFASPWTRNHYGLDLTAGCAYVVNRPTWNQSAPKVLLTDPQTWAVLEYGSVDNPSAKGKAESDCKRSGTAHGLLMWFDAEIAEGIGFSNGPDCPDLIYGRHFLPLSHPVAVSQGDRVEVVLRANLVGTDYIWQWHTTIREPSTGRTKERLEQSSFQGLILDPARLQKRSAQYRPILNAEASTDHFILALMDGTNSLETIARLARERHPSRFASTREAMGHVRDLSQRFSD